MLLRSGIGLVAEGEAWVHEALVIENDHAAHPCPEWALAPFFAWADGESSRSAMKLIDYWRAGVNLGCRHARCLRDHQRMSVSGPASCGTPLRLLNDDPALLTHRELRRADNRLLHPILRRLPADMPVALSGHRGSGTVRAARRGA